MPIKAFYITRNSVNFFKKHYQRYASLEGVYILFDTTTSKKVAYIGKTTNILKRLESHSTDTDKEKWWNVELAFTIANADDPLEEGDISYLEYLMCKKANKSGTYQLSWNAQQPHEPDVSEDDKSYLNRIFNNINILTRSFGFNIFLNLNHQSILRSHIFKITRRKSNARAEYTSQGMLILKGSKVSNKEPLKRFPGTRFSKLINQGIIKDDIFKQNYLASSPSTASSLILKAPSDGWNEWYKVNKDHHRINLNEAYR